MINGDILIDNRNSIVPHSYKFLRVLLQSWILNAF